MNQLSASCHLRHCQACQQPLLVFSVSRGALSVFVVADQSAGLKAREGGAVLLRSEGRTCSAKLTCVAPQPHAQSVRAISFLCSPRPCASFPRIPLSCPPHQGDPPPSPEEFEEESVDMAAAEQELMRLGLAHL